MKLSGTIDIEAPAATTWDFILDPASLASCVPGAGEIRRVDDRTIEGSITAAVGPMEADFAFSSVIVRSVFPDDLVVRVTGIDSMTKSTLTADVSVGLGSPDPDRTELRYEADVRVKGRLSILGDIVLRATARAMIDRVTRCIRARVATSDSTEE